MHTSRVLGVDVGTNKLRFVLYDCSTEKMLYKATARRDEIEDTLKLLQGMGISRICIAGGYQWREIEGTSILSDEIVAFGSDETVETHGLRRLIRNSMLRSKAVMLLPSGGASGSLPTWVLYNVLDSATPDKVAKSNFILHSLGLRTFTLVDDGCFTSIITLEEGSITFVLGATRGAPGKCSPGCVDAELCLYFKWPRSKRDLLSCRPPPEVIEKWIEFYISGLPKPVLRGSELPEHAAAMGAALWCCGKKIANVFSDRPKYGCLWSQES